MTKSSGTDRPEDARKREDREGAVDRHERERKRGRRKRARILSDPLIRVCEFTRRRQAMVRSVGHISGDAAFGEKFAPKQAEPLLGEARQNGYDRGPGKNRKRKLRLPYELSRVPFRDRGHKVPVDKAVGDIEAVGPDEEHEDRGEHQFRSPADLRPREASDCCQKARQDSAGGLSLGFHASPRQMAAELKSV